MRQKIEERSCLKFFGSISIHERARRTLATAAAPRPHQCSFEAVRWRLACTRARSSRRRRAFASSASRPRSARPTRTRPAARRAPRAPAARTRSRGRRTSRHAGLTALPAPLTRSSAPRSIARAASRLTFWSTEMLPSLRLDTWPIGTAVRPPPSILTRAIPTNSRSWALSANCRGVNLRRRHLPFRWTHEYYLFGIIII